MDNLNHDNELLKQQMLDFVEDANVEESVKDDFRLKIMIINKLADLEKKVVALENAVTYLGGDKDD